MRVQFVRSLAIEGVKVIRFGRFCDGRGYFTEPFRRSVLDAHPDTAFLQGMPFVQGNESYSRARVIRGQHFQWDPFMGKLVRTIHGHMVDIVLDIRRGSPTFGQAILYDMPADATLDSAEWIWVPPGLAHGNFFLSDSRIEYLCTGEYSPTSEAGIAPLTSDIDWSLCDPALKARFDEMVRGDCLISEKDRDGLSVAAWNADERSANFLHSRVQRPEDRGA